MRAGQIAILSIAFTGLLSAQTETQGPMGPPAKLPPARVEKKSTAAKLTAPVPIFRDIAVQAGLTASHISSPGKQYVIESMSGGIGLFDCDNDGKLDIVMVNGSTVDRYRQGGDMLGLRLVEGVDVEAAAADSGAEAWPAARTSSRIAASALSCLNSRIRTPRRSRRLRIRKPQPEKTQTA